MAQHLLDYKEQSLKVMAVQKAQRFSCAIEEAMIGVKKIFLNAYDMKLNTY